MQDNQNIQGGLITAQIADIASRCESPEELKEQSLALLKPWKDEWIYKINSIIDSSVKEEKNKKEIFAKKCGLSERTIHNFCNGSLPRRNNLIKIGLAAGYSVEKMNQLLQRYGKCPALYSKYPEDSVCIYVIEHDYGYDAREKYEEIIKSVKSVASKKKAENQKAVSTTVIEKKLAEIESEDDLKKFIKKLSKEYTGTFHNFYSYVITKINDPDLKRIYGEYDSNIQADQGWSAALRRDLSEINQGKWYPVRDNVISLGIRLCMNLEEINEMLRNARMEELCAKYELENVLIYALTDAEINNYLNKTESDFNPDDYFNYLIEIFSEFDLPELDEYVKGLSEDEYER